MLEAHSWEERRRLNRLDLDELLLLWTANTQIVVVLSNWQAACATTRYHGLLTHGFPYHFLL